MIEVKGLNKYYSKGRSNQVHAVNNIYMKLPDSGMVAIFGRSGCGKTTLLNCIGGLDDASSGSVHMNGKRIDPDANDVRNRNVGYIFQNYNLSSRVNVFENVASSLRLCGMTDEAEIEKRVMAALEGVGMEKYRLRLPDALSGGQQQRVAIARAIVKNPDLILADEPTGNLDEQNTVMVMDLLKEISKERLVILVTHEEHLVDCYCDVVVGMTDGTVFEVRENKITEGYSKKKKNEVYLGDMERQTFGDSTLTLEYYGDAESIPSKLRIISSGGTLYISAEGEAKLKVADRSSEIIVHEGKYEEKPKNKEKEFPECLRAPIPEGRAGRMYSFKGAVKSGFAANFGKSKKRKKMLIAGLAIFSSIIVFLSAAFGTALYGYEQADLNYNSNIVSASTNDIDAQKAMELIEDGYAEHVILSPYYSPYAPEILSTYSFMFGNFETAAYNFNSLSASYVTTLPTKLSKGRKLICGDSAEAKEGEVVITQALADMIIEMSAAEGISEYEDLIYATVKSGASVYYGQDIVYEEIVVDSKYPMSASDTDTTTLVGIVEGDEPEIFFEQYEHLQKMIAKIYPLSHNAIADAQHSGFDIEAPEKGTVYMSDKNNYDLLVINGKQFKVDHIDMGIEITEEEIRAYSLEYYGFDATLGVEEYSMMTYGFKHTDYNAWLNYYYVDKDDENAYLEYINFTNQVTKEYEVFYASIESEAIDMKYKTLPAIIMNISDIEEISLTFSTGTTVDSSYKNPYIIFGTSNVEGYYAFYNSDTKELASLVEKLNSDCGRGDVLTAEESKEYYRSNYYETFVSLAISLVVVAVIMSLCLYFIMRSALMGDIKEVGISRAIGVSKKNLCYRYFIETMVLFVLTILVGYILSSIMAGAISSVNLGIDKIMHYPLWLALVTLAGIFGVTAFCGLLPIRALLRKSPAQILAKYDI